MKRLFCCMMLIWVVQNLFPVRLLAGTHPQRTVLVLTEEGGQHKPFVEAAMDWLGSFCGEHDLQMKVLHHASDEEMGNLDGVSLIIQLNYPPYMWGPKAMKSFESYIDQGKGGWIGFHHATLLGEFDGYPMWEWFSDFMGGIRFKDYIAPTASGKVVLEHAHHPVLKGVSREFVLPDDEWYTFDRNPRDRVTVLAHVDESSYQPASSIRMGDHPVIWTNDHKKARNIYFLFGHSPRLLQSEAFKKLFAQAILWATPMDRKIKNKR
ncbi:MAG: ThuA domain-containing protein [Marinilabiliales bacterium]|nr:ThuA domain-containing protein [Marinilabiliales bacterium]